MIMGWKLENHNFIVLNESDEFEAIRKRVGVLASAATVNICLSVLTYF